MAGAGRNKIKVLSEELFDNLYTDEVNDNDERTDLERMGASKYVLSLTVKGNDDRMPNDKALDILIERVYDIINYNVEVTSINACFVVYGTFDLYLLDFVKGDNIVRTDPINYYYGCKKTQTRYVIFGLDCSFRKISVIHKMIRLIFQTGFNIYEQRNSCDLYGITIQKADEVDLENKSSLNPMRHIVRNYFRWNKDDEQNRLFYQAENVSRFYMRLLNLDSSNEIFNKAQSIIFSREVELRLGLFGSESRNEDESVHGVVVSDGGESGLSIVRFGDMYNFVNENNEVLVPNCWFMNARLFSEGVAAVDVPKSGWTFIDKSGKRACKESFYCVDSDFDNGFAVVSYLDGTYQRTSNIIDRDFNTVLDERCEKIVFLDEFPDLLIVEYLNKRKNVFRKTDRKLIFDKEISEIYICDLNRDSGSSKGGESMRVQDSDGNFNLMDRNGNILCKDWFYSIHEFKFGRAIVYDSEGLDFVGYDGKKIINDKTIIPSTEGFVSGRILVAKKFNGVVYYNYMDVNGKKLLKFWLIWLSEYAYGHYCGVSYHDYAVDYSGNVFDKETGELVNIEDTGLAFVYD